LSDSISSYLPPDRVQTSKWVKPNWWHNRSEKFGKKEKFLAAAAGIEIKFLSFPVRSLVTSYVNTAMNISDQTLVFL